MKKIKKWRYYCDHCNKSGGSSWHIEKHEKSCTKNKDRECGFCNLENLNQRSGDELIKFMNQFIVVVCNEDEYGNIGEEYNLIREEFTEKQVLEELREYVDYCPACMLSAMRLTTTTDCFPSFKFKEEKKEFFQTLRDQKLNEREWYPY